MRLLLIRNGRFLMGSLGQEKDRDTDEGPRREVVISKAFYIGVYEVTQEQYQAVMGVNPSRFKGADKPAECVWWTDAAEFCQGLSRKTGRTFRLPTEAEWEYACRAGTASRFGFGDDDARLHEYCNYCDLSNTSGLTWRDKQYGDGHDTTAPVGSFRPNSWGLYDMHGNVFEWCSDWYKDSYDGAETVDPRGPGVGPYHVLRGGSWYSPPWLCRSAYRHRFTADGRYNHLIGFRVVAETW